jgi:hypothetical protein
MKNKIICLSALILTQNLWAAESLNTKIHNSYQSFRAMGMGNAFTTVADDYSALMYNPATLAKKKRGEIQFTLAGAGLSSKTATLMTDISDAEKNAVNDSAKATAISNVLDQYYGKPLGGRIQALEIFWVRPNWGFALLPLDLTIDMSVNRQLGPALDLNIKKDSTLAYGYGKNISPNISAGVLGKVVHRDSVEQSVSALELATDSNVLSQDRFKEGITADLEIGFIWTPEFSKKIITRKVVPTETPKDAETKAETKAEAKTEANDKDADKNLNPEENKQTDEVRVPQSDKEASDAMAQIISTPLSTDATTADVEEKNTDKVVTEKIPETIKTTPEVETAKTEVYTPLQVSVVARNLISAEFSKSTMVNKKATTAPAKIPRVIDVGVGYEIFNWSDLKLLTTAEAKNLLHPETSFRKSAHVGVEFDYSPGSWFKAQVRAGMNQMYFTSGFTLLLGVLEIDAVTYGEEVGTTSANVENRVNAVKVGFNF